MAGRVSVFFDGDQLAPDRIGFRINWKRMRQHLVGIYAGRVMTLHYHGIEIIDMAGEAPARKTHDWLETNGYRVDVVEAEVTRDNSIRVARNGVLVGIAVDMMRAQRGGVGEIVLMSGDSALLPVVQQVISDGAKVTLIYPRDRCSSRLRRLADEFEEIEQIRTLICEGPKDVAA